MILHGVGVRILARNIPALYEFYTEKLGFKVAWGNRDGSYVSFAEADNGKPAFAIFAEQGMKRYEGYTPLCGADRKDQVVYCLGAENVDEAYNELKNRGVTFMGEPQTIREWWLRCVYFRDPEGNLFEIAQGVER